MQVAAGLATCFSMVLAQTGASVSAFHQDAPAPAAYEKFFLHVAQLAVAADSEPVPLSGEIGPVTRIAPREAIGLTEQEARTLNELAVDWAAESGPLNGPTKRLTFERRLWVISSQQVPDQLARDLRDLEERRVQIVVEHVRRLQAAFGSERFRILNEYIRSRENESNFFPQRPDPSRPTVKKTASVAK